VKLALVHDWLTGMRGGEKALEVVCERFPDAEIFTLLHAAGSVSPVIERRPIHTSFIQRIPGAARHYRNYLPLFPAAIERFSFERFDRVLSLSHCVAKSAVTPAGVPHLCYCFTPMRYAWDQFDAYFGPARVGRPVSAIMHPIMRRMARWDRRTAARPDRYVAISHYVAGRIGRYYNRVASVVYPPVDTDFYRPDNTPAEAFALIVSALVPYKRIELAIDACAAARVPLSIVGDGPERGALERHANGRATFLGRLPDDDVRSLYRRAGVVLLPNEEDFGIVPLEAQACGRPVVALARGGALETVLPGVTGLLVEDDSVEAFAAGVAEALATRFDGGAIRRHAEHFGRDRFGDEIEAIVRGPVEAIHPLQASSR
jgi:glycosyltransferase involved in cell wall biosynthesis